MRDTLPVVIQKKNAIELESEDEREPEREREHARGTRASPVLTHKQQQYTPPPTTPLVSHLEHSRSRTWMLGNWRPRIFCQNFSTFRQFAWRSSQPGEIEGGKKKKKTTQKNGLNSARRTRSDKEAQSRSLKS